MFLSAVCSSPAATANPYQAPEQFGPADPNARFEVTVVLRS